MGEDGLASECCTPQDDSWAVRKAAADAIGTVALKGDEKSLEALHHVAKDSGPRFWEEGCDVSAGWWLSVEAWVEWQNAAEEEDRAGIGSDGVGGKQQGMVVG